MVLVDTDKGIVKIATSTDLAAHKIALTQLLIICLDVY